MAESTEQLKTITEEEVAKHNTTSDLWVVYNGQVYDVSNYIDEHPGGEEVVLDVAGQDATEAFDDIGHSDDAREILKGLLIGKLEGGVVKTEAATKSAGTDSGFPFPLFAALIVLVGAALYFYNN
ncbi:Piso0_000785 [Millerozyma farinosa CBS 7064]|uniref:Piso0_000785 protein n=1 Tax=Pichia sorbitophila (strain ATCC MYA-4447 / BCRC 22081 / CBS 7064 / NBRC 10061 / NRRL Y-12695) TaxID=559304 RepID=G8YRI2_PICSO|nr:Piso0_000785 [Millerozyma farinosa CBS 7064]